MEEETESWKQEFTEINKQVKEAWGAAIEGDGLGGRRIRIYVSTEDAQEKVENILQKEAKLSDYKVEFTIADQQSYNEWKKRVEDAESASTDESRSTA